MVCLGSARLHDGSKVICLNLTEIYLQGRGKDEGKIPFSGKEEEKVTLQVWDQPIAGYYDEAGIILCFLSLKEIT